MAATLLADLLVALAGSAWNFRHSAASNATYTIRRTFVIGYASTADLSNDPTLNCLPLPAAVTLASAPSFRDLVESQMRGSDEWEALAARMRSGEEIYGYGHVIRQASGMPRPDAFTRLSGGYVAMRGKCLVGTFGTGIE